MPRLPAFFARYPNVSVELTGSERAVNLIEEGVDLAIRAGELADSSMIVRRIAMTPFVTVATRRPTSQPKGCRRARLTSPRMLA